MATDDLLTRLAFDDDLFTLEYSPIPDLLAVGTSQAVHVVRISEVYTASIAVTFRLASRVVALAWGPSGIRVTAEGVYVQAKLLAACADRTLRILSHDTSASLPPSITFVGAPSRSAITTVAWCPISGSSNLAASGSADGSVMLWNLSPPSVQDVDADQPTASVIARLPLPVRTISFHKAQSSLVMIYDAAGSIRIVDWTKEGRPTTMLLYEPKGLVSRMGGFGAGEESSGHAAWMPKDQAVFGSVNGSRWVVWDTRTTAGGTPARTGDAWSNGAKGTLFRWCPTNGNLFALASSAPGAAASSGGAVHIHRLASPDSPTALKLSSSHRARVHGIAWQPEGNPILCVAVGRELVWLRVGGVEP